MKSEPPPHLLAAASREKRDVWDQFRQDHELIERLKITPQEFESLGKCALLGTLTCKQDLLFILRQIREATNHPGDAPAVFATPSPAAYQERTEDRVADLNHIRVHLSVPAEKVSGPASLSQVAPSRSRQQFGIVFWAVILIAGVVWNLVIAMERWRQNFTSAIGAPVYEAPPSQAWYSNLDNPRVLIGWEILFVLAVAVVILLVSRRRPRRLKVKPI